MDEKFNSTLPSKQLQQRLMRVLREINNEEFVFEEVANPTIPESKVIFEFGLADSESFCFIDEDEIKKISDFLAREDSNTMDFFCAIRYYKGKEEKKRALKFDYYILRTLYNRNTFQILVHHKKGPRYMSPEDLALFIVKKVNEGANKKFLEKAIP